MVGNIAKLVKPTGFEAEQEQAKNLRAMAEKLSENLGDVSPLGSWTQVLARVLQGFVAARENKKADSLDDDAKTQIKKNFADTHASMVADLKTLTPEQFTAKYSGNEYATDDPIFKAENDALVEGMKKRSENANTIVHTPTGYQNLSDVVGKREFNPNEKLVWDGKNYAPNTPLISADLATQGFVAKDKNGNPLPLPSLPGNFGQDNGGAMPPMPQPPAPTGGPAAFTPANISQVESGNRDFNPDGSPVTSKAGAMYGMQVMPSTARQPGYGVTPVPPNIMNLPATDPRRAAAFDALGAQYAQAMSRRFGNLGPAAYNAGPGRVANAGGNLSALPAETQAYSAHFAPPSMPTQANRPPDGQTKDGRPVWLVNGQYYDNPQGN